MAKENEKPNNEETSQKEKTSQDTDPVDPVKTSSEKVDGLVAENIPELIKWAKGEVKKQRIDGPGMKSFIESYNGNEYKITVTTLKREQKISIKLYKPTSSKKVEKSRLDRLNEMIDLVLTKEQMDIMVGRKRIIAFLESQPDFRWKHLLNQIKRASEATKAARKMRSQRKKSS